MRLRLSASQVGMVVLVLCWPQGTLAAGGDLDSTFADGGLLNIQETRYLEGKPWGADPEQVLVRNNGGILLVGTGGCRMEDEDHDLAAFLLTPAGGWDNTYGNGDGIACNETSGYADELYRDAALQGGGLLIAGSRYGDGPQAGVVVRFRRDGLRDRRFSGDGRRLIRIPGAAAAATGVLARSGGKVMIAGSGQDLSSNQLFGWLMRLDSDGTPDRDFAGDGFRRLPWPAVGIERQAPGRFLLLTHWMQLVRVFADGRIDRSYGENGRSWPGDLTDIPGAPLTYGWEDKDFLVQPDGKGVIVGNNDGALIRTPSSQSEIVLVRYTRSGSPDESFGDGGLVRTMLDPDLAGDAPPAAYGGGIALQQDGRIVAAAAVRLAQETGGYEWRLTALRYLANGTLDPSFGANGHSYAPPLAVSYWDQMGAAIQPDDGRIVLANGWAVARFLP